MRARIQGGWGAITFVFSVVAVSGCSSESPGTTNRGLAAPAKSQRVLADMGLPAAALIVSGQLDGYFEPCGCTLGQTGGLIRRYELIDRLRRQDWPLVQVDLGGLIHLPDEARERPEQVTMKLRHGLRALALLNCDALALNADDLRGGIESTLRLFRDELGTRTAVVAANVRAGGAYSDLIRPSVIASAGALRVGITAVLDPELAHGAKDSTGGGVLTSIAAPEESLPSVIAELEAVTDYRVLMVNGPFEMAERLARTIAGFDVVVAMSDNLAARSRRPEVLNGGKTRLVTVGRRGMNVGVFAFGGEGRTHAPGFHLVQVSDTYDGPGTPMRKLIQDDYRSALAAAHVVERFARQAITGPAGSFFVGAETCRQCHGATFLRWSESKHAHALQSLSKDPRPNLIYDPECISCHATGFPYQSGWRSIPANSG